MQKSFSAFVFVGALGVAAAMWLMIPALQRPEAGVNAEAARLVERARWLVHEHEHGLTFKSMLLNSLEASGVDIAIEDPEALLDAVTDEYQQSYENNWQAYSPQDLEDPEYAEPGQSLVREARIKVSDSDLASSIDKGIAKRDKLIDDNHEVLDEALSAVNEALAIQDGDASARTYAEANRLKGVILYQQGLLARHEARRIRDEAATARVELRTIGSRVNALNARPGGGIGTVFDAQMEALEERKVQLTASLADAKQKHADAADKANELTAEADAAMAIARAKLAEIRETRDRGVDFSDPNGGDVYAGVMVRLSQEYRAAARTASSKEYGHLANASIDRTGDYVAGSYVGRNGSTPNAEKGAAQYRVEASVAEKQVNGLESAIESIENDMQSLQELKRVAVGEEQAAAQLGMTLAKDAGSIFDSYQELLAQALEAEDDAVALFDSASKSFDAASRSTDDWVRQGADELRDISSESRDAFGASLQATAGWLAGHIKAQKADAGLASAWCYLAQYNDAMASAELYDDLANTLDLGEADADGAKDEASAAKDEATTRVENAVDDLQRAHNTAGKHWTFVAQLAGANDLMHLLGYDGYDEDAKEAYRAAITSRESEGFSQRYVKRLAELESR